MARKHSGCIRKKGRKHHGDYKGMGKHKYMAWIRSHKKK